jgi:hypothetical protein
VTDKGLTNADGGGQRVSGHEPLALQKRHGAPPVLGARLNSPRLSSSRTADALLGMRFETEIVDSDQLFSVEPDLQARGEAFLPEP